MKKIHDRFYHDCYKYLKIIFKQNKIISNKKWKFSMIGFTNVVTNIWKSFSYSSSGNKCRDLTLRECEDETHTPEMGTWKSFGTPETSEFDYRGQNTSYWGVLYIIGKLSKCRCRKWACMNYLDIYNTSYGKKKGRESNW